MRDLGLPLTVNAPIHKLNISEVPDFVALALEIGAERLEIANVQYYGWAYLNRTALLPNYDAVMRQVEYVEKDPAGADRYSQYRLRHARLLRGLSETLHGRLGQGRLRDHAGRPCPALPCSPIDHLADIRQGDGEAAKGDLGTGRSLQPLPWI
ncbi:hypothetical protein QW131_00485 [Roseibium salinum]|nr:hypothetical protein [Roseibium salinum]